MREAMKRMGVGLVLSTAWLGCGGDEVKAPTIQTIRVVEHADTNTKTDNDPVGDSVGDVMTFANPVFDEANTQQVGTDQGYCVRVVAGESYECIWTIFLGDGQLTVEGPLYDAKGSTLAITGGTKNFNDARGQMQLGARDSQGKEYDFIYQVLQDP